MYISTRYQTSVQPSRTLLIFKTRLFNFYKFLENYDFFFFFFLVTDIFPKHHSWFCHFWAWPAILNILIQGFNISTRNDRTEPLKVEALRSDAQFWHYIFWVQPWSSITSPCNIPITIKFIQPFSSLCIIQCLSILLNYCSRVCLFVKLFVYFSIFFVLGVCLYIFSVSESWQDRARLFSNGWKVLGYSRATRWTRRGWRRRRVCWAFW